MSDLALLRLLQLASQALPIGGYSHSHGLENAVDQRIVSDEATALAWISGVLRWSFLSYEIPLLYAMDAAWRGDRAALERLNDEALASRETAELRAASVQMGYSLTRLLTALPEVPAGTLDALRGLGDPSLPAAWSAAVTALGIDAHRSAAGYAWSWAENQVLAAVKSVPLGQTAGQRMLLELGAIIATHTDAAGCSEPAAWSNYAPALAIAAARHETQYSRLFRS